MRAPQMWEVRPSWRSAGCGLLALGGGVVSAQAALPGREPGSWCRGPGPNSGSSGHSACSCGGGGEGKGVTSIRAGGGAAGRSLGSAGARPVRCVQCVCAAQPPPPSPPPAGVSPPTPSRGLRGLGTELSGVSSRRHRGHSSHCPTRPWATGRAPLRPMGPGGLRRAHACTDTHTSPHAGAAAQRPPVHAPRTPTLWSLAPGWLQQALPGRPGVRPSPQWVGARGGLHSWLFSHEAVGSPKTLLEKKCL